MKTIYLSKCCNSKTTTFRIQSKLYKCKKCGKVRDTYY